MASLTKPESRALALLGVAALALAAVAAKSAPGASWKTAAAATEATPPFTPPPGRPVIGPDQHLNGYTYTPHRYPPACGNDISALIHHGLTPATLPGDPESLWISAPPSEGDL